MTMLSQSLIVGIATGGLYCIIALGMVLVYKSTRIFNFAHGEFLMIGSYVGFTLLVTASITPLIAIPLLLGFAALLGVIADRLALRPMIGEPVFARIMVTLGLAVILRGVALLVWGGQFKALPELFPGKALSYGGVTLTRPYVWALVVATAITLAFVLLSKYSKLGLKMRATAEDEEAAQSLGVQVTGVFTTSWAIGGVLAAVGGLFLASISGVSLPLSNVGLKALPVVMLGGLESIPGAAVGGLIVGIVESLAATYVDPLIGMALSPTIPYLVLLLVLLFRPEGIFWPAKDRKGLADATVRNFRHPVQDEHGDSEDSSAMGVGRHLAGFPRGPALPSPRLRLGDG